MTQTGMLLGAGASHDAGLPLTTALTHEVVNAIVTEQQSRQARKAAKLQEPLSAPTLFNNSKDQTDILPARKRPSAIEFVYSQLRADAARATSVLEPQVDLEDLVTALDSLENRDQLVLGPFIQRWHDEIYRLGSGTGGMWTNQPVDEYDIQLFKFVQEVIERRLDFKPSGGFHSSIHRIRVEAERLLTGDQPPQVDYLKPIIDWAQAETPVTIASLNFDNCIETLADSYGCSWSDGFDSWKTDGHLAWGDVQIRLLKLHGSFTWKEQDDSGRDALFLLGGRNKLTADGPFIELLAEYRAMIRRVSRLIVIGYSFRDPHINSSIDMFLRRPNTELHVVDPQIPPFVKKRRSARLSHIEKEAKIAETLTVLDPESLKDWEPQTPNIIHHPFGAQDFFESDGREFWKELHHR